MDHLSSSQLTLYLQCSLKYKFQYLDGLPRPFKASGLAFGSALHSALAWFHKELAAGKTVTLERLCQIFDADWYCQQIDGNLLFSDRDEPERLPVLGREMLSLYYQKPPQGTLRPEVPFAVPLVDPATGEGLDLNLEGFIDLIEDDDVIVEFKTSAATMTQTDVDRHLQLSAYSYAFERLHGRPPRELRIVDFVKNRKPKIVTLPTTRDRTDHEWFYQLARQVVRAIQRDVFFPRVGFWCRDCEFARQCKQWRSA